MCVMYCVSKWYRNILTNELTIIIFLTDIAYIGNHAIKMFYVLSNTKNDLQYIF